MLKNNKEIKAIVAYDIFASYELTSEEIENFILEIEEDEGKAIDSFIELFLLSPTDEYTSIVTRYLNIIDQGELPATSKKKVERNIISLTNIFRNTILINFAILANKLVGPVVYAERGIAVSKLQKVISDATVGQFEAYTEKALLGTRADVLSKIRRMQREFVVFNQGRGGRLTGSAYNKAVQSFTSSLEKKFPGYYKMKDGKLFATSPLSNTGTIKYYNLKNYIEMSVRTTLLNIDRTSTEVIVNHKEDLRLAKGKIPVKVVQYYKRDNRVLKTGIEREICQDILSSKKYGAPVLALDDETASLLEIMSVRDAENTPDFAMGVNCRHSIKPISVNMRKKLEVILKAKKEAL